MNKTIIALAAALFAAFPASAKQLEISGLELQQIQARDLEITPEIAFPAVMTVLQDSGYRIQTADKATGLITAMGSSSQKMTYNIWFGFGQKKKVPVVSAFIESRGSKYTRIRLNFVMSEGKSRNSFTDEAPIIDPIVYRDAFERIEKEIFTRVAMDAPAPTPAVSPSSAPSPVQESLSATPVAAGN